MSALVDELAGVVDLFGGLTRNELSCALEEAAFRADGQSVKEEAVETALERALDEFALIEVAGDSLLDADERTDPSEPLLVAGPTAFPKTPASAEDLPHILDVGRRQLDRREIGRVTHERFEAAVDAAFEAGDEDRLRELLDVSYDIEAWLSIDVERERKRISDALE